MISASDAGITQSQHDDLMMETGDPIISFVLEQYSPSISEMMDSGDGAGSSLVSFDAIVCDDVIVRAWAETDKVIVETLPSEDAGDQSWATVDVAATDIDVAIPISLAVSGSSVRVYWYNGTSIKYNDSADKGSAWGAASTAIAVTSLQFLAAPSLDVVHYTRLTAKHNCLLSRAELDGSWTSVDSGIYWQFTPTSFDAVDGNCLDDGAAASNEIIAMSTDMPPMIGVRVEGTELVYYLERVQGLAFFRYQNGRWGDHLAFDVVDNAATYPSRSQVRLSKTGNWMLMTYRRVDGTEEYPHTSIALSRSRTGIEWELPYLITNVMDGPAILLKRGDHATLLDSNNRYRSPSVGYTGDATVIQDVSANVISMDMKMGDIQEVQVTLANPGGELDATTPFSVDAILQARVKYGYAIDGTDLLVQTLMADIDAIACKKALPTDHIVITGRDVLARLITIKADETQEWQSQESGGDNFKAVGDTIYSGIRHTAGQSGSWTAENEELNLTASDTQGIAFCTYLADAWNGSKQAGGKTAVTTSDDYWGLVFRAYNKDNLWYVKYQAEDDKLYLVERRKGIDAIKAVWTSLGWTHNEWGFLKASFRYGRIYVYTSADGIIWTERIDYQCAGVPSDATWDFGDIPNLMGRVGYTGHGYSAYTPPDGGGYPPIVLPEFPDPDPGDYGDAIGIVGKGGYAYSGDALTATSPTWHTYNTGLSDSSFVRALCSDPGNRARAACIDDTGGIYVTPGCQGESPWVSRLTEAQCATLIQIHTGVGASNIFIGDLKAFEGEDIEGGSGGTITYLLASVQYTEAGSGELRTRVVRSRDWGNAWACGGQIPSFWSEGHSCDYQIRPKDEDGYSPQSGIGELAYDGGRLFICAASPGSVKDKRCTFNYSDDWGASWYIKAVTGFEFNSNYVGPACATCDVDGKLYMCPWKTFPGWTEEEGGGDETPGSGAFAEAMDAHTYCCDDAEYSTEGTVTIQATCIYTVDIACWIASGPACPNHPTYTGNDRIGCTASKNGAPFLVFSAISGGGADSWTGQLYKGDIIRVSVQPDGDLACLIGQAVMTITGCSVPTPPDDPEWIEGTRMVASGNRPASVDELRSEKVLSPTDGIGVYRGMLDIRQDKSWIVLGVPECGCATSKTRVYIDSHQVASLSYPFRHVFCHPTAESCVFLGRSFLKDEAAATLGTAVVYRSSDGGTVYDDATGDCPLYSITGIIATAAEAS